MPKEAIFYGELRPTLKHDGTAGQEMQLDDGTLLPQGSQHPPQMVKVGEHAGKSVYHWLDDDARVDQLRSRPSYLAATLDELPADVAEQVLEVEVATEDEEGNPVTVRMKVAEAKAKGLDVGNLKAEKPHKWAVEE